MIAHAVLIALCLTGPAMAQTTDDPPILIRDVTVIDGTGARPRASQDVLIVAGRLAGLGPSGTLDVPFGARIVPGAGRFLVPGFIDTHAHVDLGPVEIDLSGANPAMTMTVDDGVAPAALRTLLAFGVTTARDPGGDTERLVAIRDAVAAGRVVGPRLFVAGAVIDRGDFPGLVVRVTDEGDVRREVARQAAAGVDFVKLYVTLTPDLVRAAIEEAHSRGVRVVAHTLMTSWTEAANAGIDGLVHIIPGSPELLPAAERAPYLAAMARGTMFMYDWFVRADYDSPEIEERISALVEHQVSLDPTLVAFEAMVYGNDPSVIDNPALSLAWPSLLENWRGPFQLSDGWQAPDFAEGQAAFPRFLGLTRLLHERGVLLTAGTDANNPWVVPGESFHRELELLRNAGIPDHEVLSIATRNGALSLGILGHVGTVEIGKRADLVLLRRNPSRDISATRTIEWVMQEGRLYEPASVLP